jgi:hypothetical protein
MFRSLSGMSGDVLVVGSTSTRWHGLQNVSATASGPDPNDAATYYVGSFLKEISVIVSGSVESTLLRSQRLGLGLGRFTGINTGCCVLDTHFSTETHSIRGDIFA